MEDKLIPTLARASAENVEPMPFSTAGKSTNSSLFLSQLGIIVRSAAAIEGPFECVLHYLHIGERTERWREKAGGCDDRIRVESNHEHIGKSELDFSTLKWNPTYNYRVLKQFGSIPVIIFVLVIFCHGATAGFTGFPHNLAVLKGEKATIACSSDSGFSLQWTAGTTYIYDGYDFTDDKYVDQYDVNKSSDGQFDITVKKANRDTALLYKCTDAGNRGATVSAELIVIDTEPKCSALVETPNVSITCEVKYSGNWAPVVEWTRNSTNYKINAPPQNTSNAAHVRSIIVMPLGDFNESFTCITKFTSDGYRGSASERTPPSYIKKCQVSHKPEDTQDLSSPNKTYIVAGVIIGAAALAGAAGVGGVAAYRGYKKSNGKEKNAGKDRQSPNAASNAGTQKAILLPKK